MRAPCCDVKKKLTQARLWLFCWRVLSCEKSDQPPSTSLSLGKRHAFSGQQINNQTFRAQPPLNFALPENQKRPVTWHRPVKLTYKPLYFRSLIFTRIFGIMQPPRPLPLSAIKNFPAGIKYFLISSACRSFAAQKDYQLAGPAGP